eukprot:Em0009g109a
MSYFQHFILHLFFYVCTSIFGVLQQHTADVTRSDTPEGSKPSHLQHRNEQTRKRKRSKWDQLTPDSPPHGSLPLPTPSTPPATPSEAAAAAAARLNAMLAAQGKLSKSTTATSTVGATTASSTLSVGQTTASDSAVTAAAAFPHFTEVDINDLALDTRMSLTKGATLSEINKSTGAYVSVRGRFMTPEEKGKNTIERALHLIVQASSQTSVNAAVRKINELINPSRGAGVLPGLGGGGGTGGGGGKGQGGTRFYYFPISPVATAGPFGYFQRRQ